MGRANKNARIKFSVILSSLGAWAAGRKQVLTLVDLFVEITMVMLTSVVCTYAYDITGSISLMGTRNNGQYAPKTI